MEYIPKVTLKLSRLDNVLEEMAGKGKDKVKGNGGKGTAATTAAAGMEVAAAAEAAVNTPSILDQQVRVRTPPGGRTSPKGLQQRGGGGGSGDIRQFLQQAANTAVAPAVATKRTAEQVSPSMLLHQEQPRKPTQVLSRPQPIILKDTGMDIEQGNEQEDEFSTPPMNEQPEQARQTAAEQGTEKRAEQLEEQEDEEERRWREQMMVDIVARTGINPQQLDGVMEVVMAAIKIRVTRVAMQVAQGAVRTERARREGEKEDEKSRKSILIHKADQWVQHDVNTQGFNLAETVTAAVTRVTQGMVHVNDAFTLGKWNPENPPTSVLVTFGSLAQKATFYKTVAKTVQGGHFEGEKMKSISCRDAFPKKYINEAKRLVQKGHVLKRNGQIKSFRVVAQGPGCIPILQHKNGQGYWVAFLGQELPPVAVQQPAGAGGGAATANRGRGGVMLVGAIRGGQQQHSGQHSQNNPGYMTRMQQQSGGKVAAVAAVAAMTGHPPTPPRAGGNLLSIRYQQDLDREGLYREDGSLRAGFPGVLDTVFIEGMEMDGEPIERY